MAGTAKPVLAVAADTPGAAAELQAALARRFGADYQGVASASAAAALEALGRGRGPVALVLAGLAAATYAASEGLRTLLLEPLAAGGRAGTTSLIRNYLGFPRGISGRGLALRSSSRRSCSVPT